MNKDEDFRIHSYIFSAKSLPQIDELSYTKNLWPVVYLLNNNSTKEAYVGETTDASARMKAHLSNIAKKDLETLHIIAGDQFNKSATLDIESNLIKYISGDGNFKLRNANLGLANHNYYQKKEVYWQIFKSIWNRLKGNGLVKHSLQFIDNSDLFKYSPYKTLTAEQKQGLIIIIKALLNNKHETIIVEGGAGTGKTILAVFLFKILHTNFENFSLKEFGDEELELINLIAALKEKFPQPTTALVVPMPSFRNTLKKVFRNVQGLSAKMVIGPAELVKNRFDIVLVDESHRLRRRVNLGSYFGTFDKVCQGLQLDKNSATELDWVQKQSKIRILFYDNGQSIKPSDVKYEDFLKLKTRKSTIVEELTSQFRVRGGNDYVNYVKRLLTCKIESKEKPYTSRSYELILFNSIDEMVEAIKEKNEEYGLARLVAGYSWEWVSKNKKEAKDIQIGETGLKWNSEADDWVNSDNAINEVGCIHTTQGYDLNFTGVIFGNEISYDKAKDEIKIIKENYFDKNGKNSIRDPQELKTFILNIYQTIMLRGIRGTYVYVCDPALRQYFAERLKSNEEI